MTTTCSQCRKPCDLTWTSPHHPEREFCTACFWSLDAALSSQQARQAALTAERVAVARRELAQVALPLD
jgi:hypothetical protein